MALIVAIPEYYQHRVKPRGFAELVDMICADNKPRGLYELIQQDTRTGREISRLWCENVMTDNGALSALHAWGVATPAQFNQIALTTSGPATTLTTQLNAANAYTTLNVASLNAAIPSGSTIVVNFGAGTPYNVVTSALAAAGATTIAVVSFTPAINILVGANVVLQPSSTDNPAALSGTTAYSGILTSGSFTYAGTGLGNRTVTMGYTFTTTNGTGNFTEAWTVSNNPVNTTGQTGTHLIFPAQTVNYYTQIIFNDAIKM